MDKKIFQENKVLIIISVLSLILISIPIIIFLCHFWGHTVSNDLAVWGTFGDFFGGTINTILSLSSLVILGYLTKVISQDTNEENKKVNLLLRRIESYDQLTSFIPGLNRVLMDMNKDINKITENLMNSDDVYNQIVKEFEKKYFLVYELYSVLGSFDVRFGHLFNYSFQSEDFKKLLKNVLILKEFIDTITIKFYKQEAGFPEFDITNIHNLNTNMTKVLNELRRELS